MKNKLLTESIWIVAFALTGSCLQAQDLGKIGKEKPFTFSGNLGGGVNFYNSNETSYTRDPLTWNLYGNFTPTIYSVSLPVSFIINQYSKSYTTPFSQFGISPTYKWIKLDLGYRNISMSPFTFDGQSFKGAGIELTPGKFRFAAFYGSLNKAISEDTTTGHLAMPQYGRIGYGAKIGYGTASNHFDIIYFHAKDDSSSIKLINQTLVLRPQENTVVGASFRFTLLKKIIWTGDLAGSGTSQDMSAQKVKKDTLTKSLDKFLYNFMDFRNSTTSSLAGQTLVSLMLKNFNTTLGYRRVEPGFQSLGTPYMLNDVEVFQWNAGTNLANGKVNINANLNDQHNDLSKQLESELHTNTGSLNLSAMMGTHASLSIATSAIELKQTDGTAHINDSVRENQVIFNVAVTPSFNFGKSTILQTLSPSVTYSLLDDRNVVTSPTTNSKTLTAVLNYSCMFTQKSYSLNGNVLYNHYEQGINIYTSYGFNAGTSMQLLKNKTLGLQLSAGYMINQFSQGNANNNITGSFNIHYSVNKKHSFSAYYNIVSTPPSSSSLQQKLPYSVTTTNVAGGLSYNYTF
ncbi:MAG TPA: hypothetical protein DIC22_02155 [Chitinophagaceae bacterium]|nr:hypothetical protein [Chitinophagaceae bacterium]